jgi:hypothetical protein
MAKTWKQKLQTGEPKVEVTDRAFAGIAAGTRMLIATPREVDALIRKLPSGSSLTLPELRSALAREHCAEATCPLTASIFLRIVAEAAWDEHLEGKPQDQITPFWRAIAPGDKVSAKLRCGAEFIAKQRTAEGIA